MEPVIFWRISLVQAAVYFERHRDKPGGAQLFTLRLSNVNTDYTKLPHRCEPGKMIGISPFRYQPTLFHHALLSIEKWIVVWCGKIILIILPSYETSES